MAKWTREKLQQALELAVEILGVMAVAVSFFTKKKPNNRKKPWR